ncbi:MAG: hypothetical protein LBG43_06800 [Treponema sp.]|jgi:CRISPR/Cas system-associated endonuclease Cas1|nr:hypothetical protein [Treponema sp.]
MGGIASRRSRFAKLKKIIAHERKNVKRMDEKLCGSKRNSNGALARLARLYYNKVVQQILEQFLSDRDAAVSAR